MKLDMSLNGGLELTTKNQILYSDSMNYGKLAMCKTANGRDWWLMVSTIGSNKFVKFLITVNGVILGPYYQNIGVNKMQEPERLGFRLMANVLRSTRKIFQVCLVECRVI
ncbi:MAG: hypothetical protein R2847_02865 [Bacteroidia bacterium]